jgi:erythromycin esterase-like protein
LLPRASHHPRPPRPGPADVDFHLAHAAAEALVWSERSFAIPSGEDHGVPDAVEASLNLRDAGMAAVTAAVFERDRDADVVVSLHNIHAADLRDAELALGGTGTVRLTSTGARLVDLLGSRAVGSLGFSFGNGTFHAYDASGERDGVVSFTAEPPVPASYEAEFERLGPDSPFILPLGHGTASLDAERPLRTATPGGYDPTRPQDTYFTTSLPAIFDGVVHYPGRPIEGCGPTMCGHGCSGEGSRRYRTVTNCSDRVGSDMSNLR